MKPKKTRTPAARPSPLQEKIDALESQRRQERQVQTALFRIAECLGSVQRLEDFYASVHKIIAELLYAKNFLIALHDRPRDLMEVVYFVDTAGDPWPPTRPLADYVRTPTAHVLKTGKALHASRSKMRRMTNEGLIEPLGSLAVDWVGVPLLHGDDPLGVIVVQSYEPDRVYSAADVRLLSFVAQHIASLLVRARAIEAERQRAAELAVVNSVQQGLASQLDIHAIFELVGEKIREITGAPIVVINSFQEGSDLVIWDYVYENGRRMQVPPRPMTPLNRYFLSQGTTLARNQNVAELLEQFGHSIPAGDMPRSFVTVPVRVRGKIQVTISLQDSLREHAFSPSDVHLLETLAGSMSVALENARLFEETQRLFKAEQQRAAELALINSVQEALASKLDMQAIYDLVGDKLRELFDAQSMFIIRYDPLTQLCHFPYIFEKGLRLQEPPSPASGISGYVLRTRQAVMINSDMDRREIELTGRPGHLIAGGQYSRSRLDVPLLVGEEARGAISLQNIDHENAFSEADLRLLQTLASSMSVALENARLFDETQRLLREAKQHAAELEIINRVGEIMSRQLDAQTIFRTVGDKITEIFHAEATSILMLNAEAGMIQPVFEWDEGKYIEEMEPFPLGTGLTSRVIQTRQPLLLGTAEEAAAFGAYYPPEGSEVNPTVTQSYLGVPIIVGEKVIGVVSVHTYTRNAYGPDSQRLLTTLASNMGVALENARLFDESERLLKETEQRATELEIINSIAQGLTRQLDLLPMIEMIGDKLRQVIHTDSIGIGLFDADSEVLLAPYAYKQNERVYPEPIRMSELSLRLARQGRTLVINKNTEKRWARYGSNLTFGPEIPRSLVLVPILVGHELVGGITLQDFLHESAFPASTVRLVETIASNIGAAIQNARLFEETQRRNAEVSEALEREKATSAILKVIASSTTDIQPVLDTISSTAARLLGSDDVLIGLVEGGRLRIAAHSGDIPFLQVGESIDLDHGSISCRAILEGRSQQILDNSTAAEESPAMRALAQQYGYRTVFSTPLVRDEDAIGCITIRRREARLLTDKQIELIRIFADQAVIAIQNVHLVRETRRLLESEQQRAAELATVNTVSRALAAETHFDTLIQLVGEQVRMIFRSDVAFVALADRDNGLIRFPYQYGEQTEPIRLGEGLVSRIIESGQPLLINQDIAERRQALGVQAVGKKARSYLGVPILAGQQVIGAISVQSLTEEGRFDEGDQRLLGTIAANVGVAIQKAQLFEEVTHQKQFYQAVINNSPAAIVLLDMQANVTGWNPEAEKLFGYTAEEALGRNVDELVANNSLTHQEAVMYSEQALSELKVKFISRRTRKDGSLVDVEVSGLPVLVNGREVGFIAIYHDITELQRARREAVAANEAKSAFLATMSHEIRTPMNAVIGMSGLLLDTDLNAEQRDYAETIRNSGDALLAIINDILDFSKIEAGRMELEEQPFDLRDCIESAVDLVAARAAEKGLDLAYQLEDEVPAAIRGDVTRLRQVLLNLLSNAVKFTDHGEVELTVRRSKDQPDELLFSVRDTGLGIRPSEMDRLFESFRQADSSTTRKYGGTGLGLAISRRLVELMSGRMWASSEGIPGKGSLFQFTIHAPEAPAASRVGRPDMRGPQPGLSGKRLLIVDDNETNRRILMLQTSKWGMQPRETGSPLQALERVRAGERFDLIILDMQMPEMDGVALARALRESGEAGSVPLVLLTSLGRREVEVSDPLFQAHLTKPLKPSSLHDILTTILAHSRTVVSAAPAHPTIDPEMARRHPLRILLAEDNAVNQKLALRLLEQMGYRADVASNGAEAIQSLERQPYDVILMDVQMPVMDGLEATRQIVARWPALQRPWIIAMTANAMQGDREMCLQAGMNFYIAKPIHVPELIAALELVTRRD